VAVFTAAIDLFYINTGTDVTIIEIKNEIAILAGMTEVTTDTIYTTDVNDRPVAVGDISNYAVSCASISHNVRKFIFY